MAGGLGIDTITSSHLVQVRKRLFIERSILALRVLVGGSLPGRDCFKVLLQVFSFLLQVADTSLTGTSTHQLPWHDGAAPLIRLLHPSITDDEIHCLLVGM